MSNQPYDATNVAVVSGDISADPRWRELPSGDRLVELSITTRGVAGTCSVPVSWVEPGPLADRLAAGSSVVVVGHVHRRFFRAGGSLQSRTEVVAHRVADGARRASVRRLGSDVLAALSALSER